MTSTDAAKYLGFESDSMVRTLARKGALKGEKRGRDWLFLREDLDAYKAAKPQREEERKGKRGRPPKV